MVRCAGTLISHISGVFGVGMGEMAEAIGCVVEYVRQDWQAAFSVSQVEEAVKRFKPDVVTLVHSDTPTGVLNPMVEIGQIVRSSGALFYVDFVSSGFGTKVDVSAACVDIGLLGSQKCLSLPPDLGIVTVSPAAWSQIEDIK